MINIKSIVDSFCKENKLNIHFSTDMPKGYETANGTFDNVKNTLYFNADMLSDANDFEIAFYLFHELRHVLQYTYPQMFSELICNSLNYVIMYDGTCYKSVNGEWEECKIDGDEAYLVNVYLGQPYELDANQFAYEQVKNTIGDSSDLEKLYDFWIPKEKLSNDEYESIYKKIDEKLNIK